MAKISYKLWIPGIFLLLAFTSPDTYLKYEDKGSRESVRLEPPDSSVFGNRINFLLKELSKPASNYIMVTAHRGNWRNAPENSVSGLRKAINMGVDIVEVDVQKTKDGVLILMHDETLDRTTNGQGRVEDFNWEEIKKLNLRKAYGSITRQPIPSFEEIMLIAKKEKKVLINVDKGSAYFNEIGEILKKTGTSELAIVKTNLDPESEKESFHSIQGAHLMPVIHLDTQKKALKIMDLYIRNFSPEIMEISFQNDTSVFFRDYEKLAKRGVKIWYTCTSPHWCGGHDDELAVDFNNKKDSWDWLINKGATVLQTDNPKELIEYLELKGFKDQKNVLKE